MKIILLVTIMLCMSCARYDWRQKYSGNENDCRELTPEMIDILKDPDRKINKDHEK